MKLSDLASLRSQYNTFHINRRRFIGCPFVVDEVSSGCPSGSDNLRMRSLIPRDVAAVYGHTILGMPLNCELRHILPDGNPNLEFLQDHALTSIIGYVDEYELSSDNRFIVSGVIWAHNWRAVGASSITDLLCKNGHVHRETGTIGMSAEFYRLSFVKEGFPNNLIRVAQSFTLTGAAVLINPAYKQSFFELI